MGVFPGALTDTAAESGFSLQASGHGSDEIGREGWQRAERVGSARNVDPFLGVLTACVVSSCLWGSLSLAGYLALH